MTRIAPKDLRSKIMTAEEAAALIASGDTIGMSGFTGPVIGTDCDCGTTLT